MEGTSPRVSPGPALASRPNRLTADRSLALLFTLTIFVSASLLFLVQPMVAKALLPLFGGTAAVWTTAMLFFQAALLVGYALAHLSLTRLGPRTQSRVQLGVLAIALLSLPLAAPQAPGEGDPLIGLLALLATGIGLPFVAISTSSPVLQRWFSVSGHARASNAYVLYIASNIGSLLALLAYPFLIEPVVPLELQRLAWSGLYVVFIALSAVCAFIVFPLHRASRAERLADATGTIGTTEPIVPVEPVGVPLTVAEDERVRVEPVGRERTLERGRWLLLALIPSSLMLGATSFLSTDIASAPFMWVLPLALYLASFIVAFSRYGPVATRVAGVFLPMLAVIAPLDIFHILQLPAVDRLIFHLALFTTIAVLCHGRLASSRPPVERLTEFYLLLAVGGVSGGFLNAVIAPFVFKSMLEYPLAIGAALLVRPSFLGSIRERWGLGFMYLGIYAVLALLLLEIGSVPADMLILVVLAGSPLLFVSRAWIFALTTSLLLLSSVFLAAPAVYSERNFYGLFRIVDTDGTRQIIHGTTVHGSQIWPPQERPTPIYYYHPNGPLGDAMALRAGDWRELGILGLGSGGVAAYGEEGQRMTFYEIDPAIADVALDERYFTYLSATPAQIEVRVGDGRLLIEEEPSDKFDLLMMDAFSSDAVPAHLLTLEAFEIYLDRLARDGVLVVHISNRYLDLEPVVSAAARDLGLAGMVRFDLAPDGAEELRVSSRYVVLAREEATLADLAERGWRPLRPTDRHAWTDDFSDIISLLFAGGETTLPSP